MVKKRVIDAIASDDPKTKRWRMLFSSARMAYESGELRQAETLLARAYELAKELPESSFALQATEIGSAAVLLAEKRSKEAMKRLDRCISKLSSYSDPKHSELTGVAIRFRAQALLDLGDEREAENELKRSAALLADLGIDAAVQLAYSLSDLCALYLMQGRHSEAEPKITKVMTILSAALGPQDAEYTRADMIYQLCLPMQPETRLEAASDGVRRMEYSFGNKHPNISRALDRYIKVLSEKGSHEKLEEVLKNFGLKTASKH
ncbi:MAG: hypothetical protein K2X27_21835 [Candidatus Obscuribacterales bacterium]|nr:hypothetical protein [Candidatus Obscuribacterales bacterium]